MVQGVPQNSLCFSFAISQLKLYQGISSLTFFNMPFHWLLKIVQHFILRLFCCSSCCCCLYCCCGSVFCSCSYCNYLSSIKVYKTWSLESNSSLSLSLNFAPASFESLKFRNSVFSLFLVRQNLGPKFFFDPNFFWTPNFVQTQNSFPTKFFFKPKFLWT